MDPTEISRVAIVGTGLIGSSWAACFLAHGLDVVATDPAPGAQDKVRQYVEAGWAALTKIGLAPGASTSRLRFTTDLKEAIAGADLVQENAPVSFAAMPVDEDGLLGQDFLRHFSVTIDYQNAVFRLERNGPKERKHE